MAPAVLSEIPSLTNCHQTAFHMCNTLLKVSMVALVIPDQAINNMTMQVPPCALQVFRAWTQDTAELIQERPQKLMRLVLATHYPGCRPTPQVTGADMLSAAPLSAGFCQGGRWGAELEDLFASCMRPAGPGVCHQPLTMCDSTGCAIGDRVWVAKQKLWSSLL